MLQLFDLARENAELKCELTRIRQQAETLRRLLADKTKRKRAADAALSVTARHHRMTTDELLAQLRASRTDLGRFVEAMLRDQRPHLVVPANVARVWQEREPQTWAMVCDWLAEQGKSVVQV